MPKTTIIQGAELTEYFRGKVQAALANQSLIISELTEFYLVNLLQEFRRAKEFLEQPMALLLLEAMNGDTATRTRCLKQLGDSALYLSGYFSDSLRNKLVDQNYYIAMGGSAYGSLAAMFAPEKTFAEIFGELAEKFSPLVTILAEVAPWNQGSDDVNLLKMYERWLATGDERLRELLERKGITATPFSPERKLQ
ncbi:MAG: hypothetical protein HY465_01585 [Deltaproteobacteria bacterium]|nr:hypothetical protein [Deltaproteobacteria bacterium]